MRSVTADQTTLQTTPAFSKIPSQYSLPLLRILINIQFVHRTKVQNQNIHLLS